MLAAAVLGALLGFQRDSHHSGHSHPCPLPIELVTPLLSLHWAYSHGVSIAATEEGTGAEAAAGLDTG